MEGVAVLDPAVADDSHIPFVDFSNRTVHPHRVRFFAYREQPGFVHLAAGATDRAAPRLSLTIRSTHTPWRRVVPAQAPRSVIFDLSSRRGRRRNDGSGCVSVAMRGVKMRNVAMAEPFENNPTYGAKCNRPVDDGWRLLLGINHLHHYPISIMKHTPEALFGKDSSA